MKIIIGNIRQVRDNLERCLMYVRSKDVLTKEESVRLKEALTIEIERLQNVLNDISMHNYSE